MLRSLACSRLAALAFLCLGFASLAKAQSVSVFASGFDNPRGLKFGPDGYLYVAEGGAGGTLSTVGKCPQAAGLPDGPGPYTGGFTSRISKVDHHGHVSTVADHLPSSQTSAAFGNLVSGVADIAFFRGRLYALEGGAGCSHGLFGTSNGVLRINSDGTWKEIADLSAFVMANPTKNENADDFEPDGTWYSMISVHGRFYAVEPNHGELDSISTDGTIRRVADISASQGHIVPTVVAYHDGDFYVGNLDTFPITPGASVILKISRAGEVCVWAPGFNTILGLDFDDEDNLYVLENTVGAPGPTPGLGQVVRINEHGTRTVVVSGLFLPTGLTVGPDGNLYVSNYGFGLPPNGSGQIVKITIHSEED
jgi:hypothetical protein